MNASPFDEAGRNWIGDRMLPSRTDVLEAFQVHADAVDVPVGGIGADQNRNVVAVALAVDDIGEQERFAISLGNAAAELPADQRMHLRVLVDGRIDAIEQPRLVETLDMVMKIGVAARRDLIVFDVGDHLSTAMPGYER